jgi:glucose dehydrogenase
MKRIARPLTMTVAGLALILMISAAAVGSRGSSHSAKVTIPSFSTADLNNLPANDWISPAGNLWGQRHSSLTSITTANVSGLKQAWKINLKEPVPKGQDPLGLFPSEAAQDLSH